MYDHTPARPGTRSHTAMSRRDALSKVSIGAAALSASVPAASFAASQIKQCTLGFSTYGMKTLSTGNAVDAISAIGYDSLELCVRPGWDADSARLAKPARRKLRTRIENASLRLASLMEHVFPIDAEHQVTARHRLKLAADLAHELSPEAPPMIQTVLGGGDFESVKSLLAERLEQWVRLAESNDVTIAIKPHRGGVVSKPSEAVWLIEQLGAPPCLRLVYDYSHYAFRDLSLEDTVETAHLYTGMIAVKDAVKEGDRVVFRLPGESDTFDYERLLGMFYSRGYRGDVNCEVSSMVSSRPGYDPIEAAKICYRKLSTVFTQAKIPRPQ